LFGQESNLQLRDSASSHFGQSDGTPSKAVALRTCARSHDAGGLHSEMACVSRSRFCRHAGSESTSSNVSRRRVTSGPGMFNSKDGGKSGSIVYTLCAGPNPGNARRALVNFPEQRTVIDDIQNAIADLFEGDVFTRQGVAEKGLTRQEAERASRAHAPVPASGLGAKSCPASARLEEPGPTATPAWASHRGRHKDRSQEDAA
jgi:hypothetical protein